MGGLRGGVEMTTPVKLKQPWIATLVLRVFSFVKIPLLAFVRPTVLCLDGDMCEIKIPLAWRTKNHLNSMYFGALAIGADTAGGIIASEYGRKKTPPVHLIFKDMKGTFLKRPMGDVHFICRDGAAIIAAIDRAALEGTRVNIPVHIAATVPSIDNDPVAVFDLTLSLKVATRPA